MTISAESEREICADILARGIEDVVAELRVIDPVDLVSFIRFGSYLAIEDLLQSSAELFFKDATLTFGWSASVEMGWGETPRVTLGLEFRHRAVSVFFNLSIHAMDQIVQVTGIFFDAACPDPMERVTHLAEAVSDARLPRRVAAVSGPLGPRSPRP